MDLGQKAYSALRKSIQNGDKEHFPKIMYLKTPLIKRINLEEGEENAAVAIHGTSSLLDT